MLQEKAQRDSGWASFLDARKEGFALYEVDIYEVRITRRGDGWLAMLKGIKAGRYLVAFVSARSYEDAIFLVGHLLRRSEIRWLADKFAPKPGNSN